jgi:uncharacterized protein (DUF1778 family)
MEDNIHIRCDDDLKRLVRRAAALNDEKMSDYIRRTLREAADGDVPEEVQPAD